MYTELEKQDFLENADGFFGDNEAAKEFLDNRIEFLSNIDRDIELYRVVMVKNENDIDIANMGSYWTPDLSDIDDCFISYLKYTCAGKTIDGDPYLLKAVYPISAIDMDSTLAQNLLNPDENEIYIKDQNGYKLSPMVANYKDKIFRVKYEQDLWQARNGIDDFVKTEFTCGGCYDLAYVLREITGWDIYVELDGNDILHAWVKNEDGCAVDINGVHSGNWAKTGYHDDMPKGRIEKYDNPNDGLGNFGDWAKEIVKEFPEHFGVQDFKLKKKLKDFLKNSIGSQIKNPPFKM